MLNPINSFLLRVNEKYEKTTRDCANILFSKKYV